MISRTLRGLHVLHVLLSISSQQRSPTWGPKTQMLKSCDFTSGSVTWTKLCGCLGNNDLFFPSSSIRLRNTPTTTQSSGILLKPVEQNRPSSAGGVGGGSVVVILWIHMNVGGTRILRLSGMCQKNSSPPLKNNLICSAKVKVHVGSWRGDLQVLED